jgi:hypothetical protein
MRIFWEILNFHFPNLSRLIYPGGWIVWDWLLRLIFCKKVGIGVVWGALKWGLGLSRTHSGKLRSIWGSLKMENSKNGIMGKVEF